MNNELSIQLSELAKKLGTSVDHLYALTVKQAKIQLAYEIAYFITFTGFVIGSAVLYTYLPDFDSNENYMSLMDFSKLFSMIIGGISLGIYIMSLPSTIKDIVTLYSNPEYWAMQDILASIDLKSDN